jgi:hypothetical protein
VIFSAGVIGVSLRGAVVSSGDVHDEARPMMVTRAATKRDDV